MAYTWQQITDKTYWNKLVSSQSHTRFLQSWQWGEFQQSLGREILRLSWQDTDFIQAIKMSLPGGFGYWYIPQAKIFDESFFELQKMLSERGGLFLRIDPVSVLNPSGKIEQVSSVQPRCTLLLDLNQTAEELLSDMHAKTRYNISLGEKRGVKISAGTVNDFVKLNHATTTRDKFISHPDWYYKKMSETLIDGDCFIKVWQATYETKVIASAMVMYFGDTVTYLHGASANEFRNVMAPYLLHWKIIQDAQKQGFKFYDWWGINPMDENHSAYKQSWEGISRFKAGFGGKIVCNPPTFDLIYRVGWYRVYKILSRVKRSIS